MKDLSGFFGIIVFVMIIGILIVSCDIGNNGSGDVNNGGSDENKNYTEVNLPVPSALPQSDYYEYYFSMLFGAFGSWNNPVIKTLDKIFLDGAGKNYSDWKSETGYTLFKSPPEEYTGTDNVLGNDRFHTDRPGVNWFAGVEAVAVDGKSYKLKQFPESGLTSFQFNFNPTWGYYYYFAHHTGNKEAIIINVTGNGGANMTEGHAAYFLKAGTGGVFPIGTWESNWNSIVFTETQIFYSGRSFYYRIIEDNVIKVSTDPDDAGGGEGTLIDFSGEYNGALSSADFSNVTTTATLTSDSIIGGTPSAGSAITISNVTFSGRTKITYSGINVGEWAYIYSGSEKIGIVFEYSALSVSVSQLILGKTSVDNYIKGIGSVYGGFDTVSASDMNSDYTGALTKSKL